VQQLQPLPPPLQLLLLQLLWPQLLPHGAPHGGRDAIPPPPDTGDTGGPPTVTESPKWQSPGSAAAMSM